MSLQRAYHHLSEEKRDAIMALAREGFSGARIARHCGISEATVSREFSRQFPQCIPLKERRKRYEASAAHTRYRENRKKSKPKGKLLPQVIETAEKLIRRGYSPEQMAKVKSGLVCKFAFRGTAGDGRLGGHHPLLLVRDFNQRLYDFRCHELLKSFGTEKSSARLSLMAFFNQDCAMVLTRDSSLGNMPSTLERRFNSLLSLSI